ncbi:sporozoite surface protein 2 isoform X2 [Drosophila hydei]|uniref:Sporozoite surface protein 2 isoform X2 n=1 Tax=Drosophila hydei TaxID=7224 RepID=A0A6J2T0L5_DROHY|nr:sporozoite surface protein 2 isoform X2 [Drosophila hydei]
MVSKDGLLSLGLLLIALLNAQLLQAYADHRFHGNAYSGGGWGYPQPQRPLEHQHHNDYHGPHHRHGYHPSHHHDPTDAQIGPGFGRGSYGGGQPGDVYAGQPSVGRPIDGVANEAQQGTGYGCVCGQLPEAGNGQGQPGFGNQAWPRYPEVVPSRPRPIQPQQPNPLDFANEQGYNPLVPRTLPGAQDPSDPNYQQPSYTGNPLQPRPLPGVQDPSLPNYQQPSYIGNPLQPRPLPGVQDPNYQQPSYIGNPVRPRPEGPGNDQFELQPDGNTGKPLQPRPEVAANGQPEFRKGSTVIQRQPTNSNEFDSQPSDEPAKYNPNSSSNLLAASSYRNQADQKSDTEHIVDDNIASIFKTDFNPPNQNEEKEAHGLKDAKAKAMETQPESIGERNLFDSNPKCSEGTELRGGRCRQKA